MLRCIMPMPPAPRALLILGAAHRRNINAVLLPLPLAHLLFQELAPPPRVLGGHELPLSPSQRRCSS